MNDKKLAVCILTLGTLIGIKLYGDKRYIRGLLEGATLGMSKKEDSEKEKVEKEEA